MSNIALITAAGKGTRMNSKVNKILLTLKNKSIIEQTIEVFEACEEIDSIIIVGNSDDIESLKQINEKNQYKKIKKIIEGGKQRQDSVFNGIKAADASDGDIILIHNGANPFVDEKTILECIKEAKEHGAAVAALPAKDTVKEVESGFVSKTLDRKRLWQMQTPQAIKYGLAKEAFEKAYADNYYGTDDVGLVERLGKKVKIVECNDENIKLTTKSDLKNARVLINSSLIGIGQDSHKFTDEKKDLVLGGLIIPDEPGLEANSDGDVMLHSLFNALSQAVGEKSLGNYADSMCENGIKDSKEYLKVILDIINKKNYKINNVGFMMEAKKPRLGANEDKIKENIAGLLGISKEKVGITVTSGEELTPFGQGKAIQVFSVASLTRK